MGVGCGLPAWIGEAEDRERGSPKIWNCFIQKTGAQNVITHGPLFRHGPKIFCAASHTVGCNKLCGIT